MCQVAVIWQHFRNYPWAGWHDNYAVSSYAGGGLKHGTVLHVEDQVQEFKVQIEISHKVSQGYGIWWSLPLTVFRSVLSALQFLERSPADVNVPSMH